MRATRAEPGDVWTDHRPKWHYGRGSMAHRPPTALFDIDGTLALRRRRSPYDWRRADSDVVNSAVATVLRSVHLAGLAIVYLSGRPEEARAITEDWLTENVGVIGPLFLRPSGDARRDAIVKREIYERHLRQHHEVVMVFDDRDQVVRMWRDELGLTCFQVADGDF